MLTEYENRPALGRNKQLCCFRMVRSLLLVSTKCCCYIVDTIDEIAALAAAHDEDDDDGGSCKLYRIHLLTNHTYIIIVVVAVHACPVHTHTTTHC